jgi:hypothetical protein
LIGVRAIVVLELVINVTLPSDTYRVHWYSIIAVICEIECISEETLGHESAGVGWCLGVKCNVSINGEQSGFHIFVFDNGVAVAQIIRPGSLKLIEVSGLNVSSVVLVKVV